MPGLRTPLRLRALRDTGAGTDADTDTEGPIGGGQAEEEEKESGEGQEECVQRWPDTVTTSVLSIQ